MELVDIDLEKEKKEIIRRYRKLLKSSRPILKDDDINLIRKAFNMALDAHKDMRRKSGEPYIYHPIAVAQICVDEIGLGSTAIICALLHDVVEDTHIELMEIERIFNPRIARIIDGLTKIAGVFEYGSSQQAENFRKMLLTLSYDVRVILIKLADRLHNMRTLESMARDKQLKIASETIYLYAPLAHRLGLYNIKSELEDLYLKYTDPQTYRMIAHKIKQTKASRNKFIRDFIQPIDLDLGKHQYPFTIKGRPKSIFSIWNKMRVQNIPFEEVFDLFAIRIIVDAPLDQEKAACWQVYSIVTDFYKPSPDRLRDWISTPRANGYESLHTTVMSQMGQWVEVQIRTARMDEIAEKGYAAHWKYKDGNPAQANNPEAGLDLWLNKVREALENNDLNALDFVDNIRANLFKEEVFVFTPKGELKTLPAGATALDFAFEIHSDIGAHCIGAKVNQKMVPLSFALNNGDQIEILTSVKQKPHEDWLNFVVSSKARVKIKEALKENLKILATDGKETIERKMKHLKLELTGENLKRMLSIYHEKSPIDFFAKVAKGQLNLDLLKQLKEVPVEIPKISNVSSSVKITDKKAFEKEIERIRGEKTDMLLIGEDMSKIDYTLAKCCNPIPGEDVFGFITVSEGIKIHKTTCPNAIELMSNYGYRIIKARWTSQEQIAVLAGIKIMGTDRVGIMNDITKIISEELKVNMRSLSIESDDGLFEGKITLYIHDTTHMDKLINRLKNVQGVFQVNRFESDSLEKVK